MKKQQDDDLKRSENTPLNRKEMKKDIKHYKVTKKSPSTTKVRLPWSLCVSVKGSGSHQKNGTDVHIKQQIYLCKILKTSSGFVTL